MPTAALPDPTASLAQALGQNSELGTQERRWVIGAIAGAHILGAWGLLQIGNASQERPHLDATDVIAPRGSVDAGCGCGGLAQAGLGVPHIEEGAARVGAEAVRARRATDGCKVHAGDVSPCPLSLP